MGKYDFNSSYLVLSRLSPNQNEWESAAGDIIELNYQDQYGRERRLLICDTKVLERDPTKLVIDCRLLGMGSYKLSFRYDAANQCWFMKMERLAGSVEKPKSEPRLLHWLKIYRGWLGFIVLIIVLAMVFGSMPLRTGLQYLPLLGAALLVPHAIAGYLFDMRINWLGWLGGFLMIGSWLVEMAIS